MRKLLAATFVGLLLAVGIAPAGAASDYSVYQRTLATFSESATGLTSLQRSQVKAAVEANPNAEKFICTGIRYYSQPMSVNIMVRKRAKASCEYAKELNPSLSTWYQNKPTQARSYAGKVLLTIKSPNVVEVPPPAVLPPEPSQSLPRLDPEPAGDVSAAERALWGARIVEYRAEISKIAQEIQTLQGYRASEEEKLAVAQQYGDTIREAIQTAAIREIDARISRATSRQDFYASLVRTYQDRLSSADRQAAAERPAAGPTQGQIDSWERLISLYESSIATRDSRIARVEKGLVKLRYWMSIAEKYSDTARVAELEIEIAGELAEISEDQAEISAYEQKISELRHKISS